ncbi:MAG: glycoside hydrolase family 38, partial [Planctomycetota bacterium]
VKNAPTRHLGTMLADNHTMENEYLRVAVQPNGTLKLTDKRNNQIYPDLLTFEDRSDIGDGWFHVSAVNDQAFSSTACSANVAVVADGIAKATLKVVLNMELPRDFRFDKMVRNEEIAPLRITNFITLRAGSDYLEVKTIVENTIRDHRLRVLLPSGTQAQTYFADSAYDIIERSITLDTNRGDHIEMETETKPQYTWTAVHDPDQTSRGLAVISTGLPESAVRDLPDRPIALTLLRSFFNTVLTSGEEGGEIQGTHVFNYAIMPLGDELPRTRLCRLGQQLAAPARSIQLEPRDLGGTATSLPSTHSFIKTPPHQAVITAIQQRSDSKGLVIRMFNPYENVINETLEFGQKVRSAERTDLEGKTLESLPVSGNQIEVAMKAKQIATLRTT